jgi:hypothetical protein
MREVLLRGRPRLSIYTAVAWLTEPHSHMYLSLHHLPVKQKKPPRQSSIVFPVSRLYIKYMYLRAIRNLHNVRLPFSRAPPKFWLSLRYASVHR